METRTAYLPARQVRDLFHISKPTLYRWLKDADLGFPRPMVIRRQLYFDMEEIEAFITSRKAGEAA